MPGYVKIILIVLVLLYIFSPYDLIPDLFPPFGWLDDAFVLGLLVYILRKGVLPGILSALFRRQTAQFNRYSQDRTYSTGGSKTNQSGRKSPYEILGVGRNAGMEEIHAAFRDAAQKYHPDKVSHLGPELKDLANEKFIEIQEAYEELQKMHKV
ncbi:MAG: DnaJ domain-containing protein [Deltaproteobacteria bacterium]|nr:DnaJ domain-containing protein [Deltaproteobacteria bacterium]